MADAYSDKIIGPGLSYGGLRTYVSGDVSNVDGMTSSVNLYCRTEAISISDYEFTYGGWIDGSNATGDQSSTAYNSSSSWATVGNELWASKYVTKGYGARSVEVWSWCRYPNGTTAVAKVYVSIPARDSHTVNYNANEGSGAPSSQTKWYGDILTLSSAVPTRTNYRFEGWSTTKGGSVEYAAGGLYGADVDVTLYAVWTLLYRAPTVNYQNGYRVGSATSTTESAMGTYARLTFKWSVDTTIYSSNTGKSFDVACVVDGSTTRSVESITPSTPSGTSGTVVIVVPLATTEYGTVTLTVTDSCEKAGSTSTSGIVGKAHVPVEFANGGTSVGLLNSASSLSDSITLGSLTLTSANTPTTISATMEEAIEAVTHPMVTLFSGSIARGGSVTFSDDPRNYRFFYVVLEGQEVGAPGMLTYPAKNYIACKGGWDDGNYSYQIQALISRGESTTNTWQYVSGSQHYVDGTGGIGRNLQAVYAWK